MVTHVPVQSVSWPKACISSQSQAAEGYGSNTWDWHSQILCSAENVYADDGLYSKSAGQSLVLQAAEGLTGSELESDIPR